MQIIEMNTRHATYAFRRRINPFQRRKDVFCALLIQKLFRGHQGRLRMQMIALKTKLSLRTQASVKEENSVIHIQKAWRFFSCGRERLRVQENASAVVIQSLFRMRLKMQSFLLFRTRWKALMMIRLFIRIYSIPRLRRSCMLYQAKLIKGAVAIQV